MKITFLALGSRGDILPCHHLAKALVSEGHQIRFGTFHNFASLITQSGFDFHPIRGDIQRILNAPSGLSFIGSERNPLRMILSLRKMFGDLAETMAEDIFSPALFDTDLLINQLPGGLYGYTLAEKLGIPHLLTAVMPLTPTAYQPQFVFPSAPSVIPGYNSFTHWIAYQLAWQIFRPIINRWRVDVLGLQRAPLWGFIKQYKSIPALNGFSAHVVPRPPDWGENIHITGYWFPEKEEWQPPDNLREFIDAGTPPVFIGFGSMPMRDPKHTTRIVLDALNRLGCRAILHAGWGGLGQEDLPSTVHLIEYASYEWLFPRMAAIVHHGGSGTTAFALRAGVPSLIVPFVFDQFYWGKRVYEMGVGPKPIPYKKLTADRLQVVLNTLLTNTQMHERAALIGEKIQEEDGVGSAVHIIDSILKET